DGTTRCPFERKNSRKSERISALVFINRIDPGIAGTPTDVREPEFSVELVAGIADIGAGNGAYCGGIEAAAQEKGRAPATFLDVAGGLAAEAAQQLSLRQCVPVAILAGNGAGDFRIGDAVRSQFRGNPAGAIALTGSRSGQQFGKARVALQRAGLEGIDR